MPESALSQQAVTAALESCKDPETGRSIVKQQQIQEIVVEGDSVQVTVGLSTHSSPLKADVQEGIESRLRESFSQLKSVNVKLETHHRPPQKLGQIGLTAKSVIAVGSGKGGVGKSTVSTSLAMALKRAGCSVGLLDADVYGPSVPQLTGMAGRPAQVENKIQPLDCDGMAVMSIGFLVPPDQAVIWRGPMLHSAMTNFLRDTQWGELDYLIIDMPPGTGDIALSLSQMLPLTGAIIVCTPQDVALADAIKAVAMFRKVQIPILGVVENMSGFLCPDNNRRYDIFGKGGAKQYAENEKIPFLGEVPISIPIRERGDEGRTADNFDDPQVAPFFEKIAYQLAKSLADSAATQPTQPQLPVLG